MHKKPKSSQSWTEVYRYTRKKDNEEETEILQQNWETEVLIESENVIGNQDDSEQANNYPTSPNGPRKQTTEPILGTALLGKNSYTRLNGKAWLGLLPVRIYREMMTSSCPLT